MKYTRRQILRAAALGGALIAGELWIPGQRSIFLPLKERLTDYHLILDPEGNVVAKVMPDLINLDANRDIFFGFAEDRYVAKSVRFSDLLDMRFEKWCPAIGRRESWTGSPETVFEGNSLTVQYPSGLRPKLARVCQGLTPED
jgi:hypothetical protein